MNLGNIALVVGLLLAVLTYLDFKPNEPRILAGIWARLGSLWARTQARRKRQEARIDALEIRVAELESRTVTRLPRLSPGEERIQQHAVLKRWLAEDGSLSDAPKGR